jgi:hypothetical protein
VRCGRSEGPGGWEEGWGAGGGGGGGGGVNREGHEGDNSLKIWRCGQE